MFRRVVSNATLHRYLLVAGVACLGLLTITRKTEVERQKDAEKDRWDELWTERRQLMTEIKSMKGDPGTNDLHWTPQVSKLGSNASEIVRLHTKHPSWELKFED